MARQLKKSSERAIGINVSLPDWLVSHCEIMARHGDSTRSRFIRACIKFALCNGVYNTTYAARFIREWGGDEWGSNEDVEQNAFLDAEDNENG